MQKRKLTTGLIVIMASKIAKYFAKRWSYIVIISAVWVALILLGIPCQKILPSMIMLGYFARICDDYFDFRKDKGSRLSKRALLCSSVVLAVLLMSVSAIFYSVKGLSCLFLLAYIIAMNKIEFLKLFVLPIALAYILFVSEANIVNYVVLILAVLVLNILLFGYKRGKKKCRKK